MTSQGPSKDEEKGRVLQFRPRTPRSWNAHLRLRDKLRSPVEDLSKYSRDRDEDNFRHRMKVNLLAFAALALIVACGVWLANTMAEMRKNQDCVLTGRTNCAPIQVPTEPR
jgi:ferric-dicitrate binding protein FerR (iron transport regulator)